MVMDIKGVCIAIFFMNLSHVERPLLDSHPLLDERGLHEARILQVHLIQLLPRHLQHLLELVDVVVEGDLVFLHLNPRHVVEVQPLHHLRVL